MQNSGATTISQADFAPDNPTEPRPFRCEYCAKTYTRLDHLSRHLRSHTKEKPFTCSICQKSFSRRDLLHRHGSVHKTNQNTSKRQRLSSVSTSRAPQACTVCASSKLKCDGAFPCSRCVHRKSECQYAQRPARLPETLGAPLEEYDTSSSVSISAHLDLEQSMDSNDLRSTQALPGNEPNLDSLTRDFDYGSSTVSGAPVETGVNRPGIFSPLVDGGVNPLSTIVGCFNHENDRRQLRHWLTLDYVSPLDGISPYDQHDLSFAVFLNDVMSQQQQSLGDQNLPSFDMEAYSTLDLLDFSTDNLFQDILVAQPAPISEIPNPNEPPQRLGRPETTSGVMTPLPGRGGLSLGIQAFKESLWNYAPSANNHSRADQLNLSIAIDSNVQDDTSLTSSSAWPTLNQAKRDSILASVIAQCDANIIPHVVSSFPSTDLLSGLIHLFLISQDADDDSYIHTASFDPNEQHTVLLLAAVAAGAVQSDNSNIRRLGLAFQEAARTAVAEMFESDNRNVRSLTTLQSHSIHLDVGLWSGDRRRLEIAESFALPLITMMRRGGSFRQARNIELPNENDPPHLVEDKWRSWIEQESFNRLAFHLFVKDAQTSISLQNAPLISIHEMTITLPWAKELWKAKTAAQWKQVYFDNYGAHVLSHTPSARACADDLAVLTDSSRMVDMQFATSVMLCNLWSMTWQFRELLKTHHNPTSPGTKLVLQSLREETLRAIEQASFHLEDASGSLETGSKIMLERIKMNMHVALDDVQLLAGKAGEDEARRIYPSLKSWTTGIESRHAIWHAGQIFRYCRDLAPGKLRSFLAVTLYHASLILWAFSILSNPSTDSRSSAGSGKTNLTHAVNKTSNAYGVQSTIDSRIVQLDSDDEATIQRFIVLGTGVPSIVSYHEQNRRAVLPLSDAQGIMSSIRYLLRERGAPKSNDAHASLIHNLTKLMNSLGKAANAMRTGQKPLAAANQTISSATR